MSELDIDFYKNYYPDLRELKNRQAAAHYRDHGIAEGRFPSQAHLNKAQRGQILPLDFDLDAYKFYNKDLLQSISKDEQFIQHYFDHGRIEGRIYKFKNSLSDSIPLKKGDEWKAAFKPLEFLSTVTFATGSYPKDKKEALELFLQHGIAKVLPISFEYWFDPEFYRQHIFSSVESYASDADLYREWLREGFREGKPPNESVYLQPFLNGLPFPLHFDWVTFKQLRSLPSTATRCNVLIDLFEQTAAVIIRNVGLLGQDADWILDLIGKHALSQGNAKKAASLLAHNSMAEPTAERLCLLGDANRALNDNSKALIAYLESISLPGAPISSFLRASDILANQRRFDEAFDILRIGHPLWRQKIEFVRAVEVLIQAYFEHQSARAHALLREADEGDEKTICRREVDSLLNNTLRTIKSLIEEFGSLPSSLGRQPRGYVSILANDDLRQCNHYRIEQKLLAFDIAGVPVQMFSHSDVSGFLGSLVGARAAIFYRVAALPSVIRAIITANSMDIPTYYEIDDLIFDSEFYPDPYASFEGEISRQEYAGLQFGVPLFRFAMSLCKASIASTPALAEHMQKVTQTSETIIIRNGLDKRNGPALLMGANRLAIDAGRVRLFYGSGTRAHNADFNIEAAPAILKLMEDHPKLDLVIAGHLKLRPEFSKFENRILRYPFIDDVVGYWSVLASCDINLAVLTLSTVADCKSEIKWLEAAQLGIPSVVSNTRTYREIIENDVNGLLAKDSEEWQQKLLELISSSELRRRVGNEARQKALRHYAINVGANALRLHFGQPARAVEAQPKSVIKILVCNVFYKPQSYGGATRVVEDNVRDLCHNHPDLELAVFCANEGAEPSGRLSLTREDDVPVYRLSTEIETDMDWRPFNDQNVEPFEQVLDHFQPDIIHFHCIQRLTASIVEVALARGIPYIVTVHDAWWISDHQFLVDEDGFLQLPSHDALSQCKDSRHGVASIERRKRLASLLHNANHVLSVSASFSDIYSRAGVGNLRVVTNGTPDIQPAESARRKDGRVALGHIGGRSAHKGATLVEAVLRQNEFTNLHLTLVDGNLGSGQVIEVIWGNTPVTLIPPCPQSQVGRLYSRLDVLLAPSTWPESFGLVAREAQQCKKWVVASQLGAMGDDIQHGIDGFLIDTQTTDDLLLILKKIDLDPTRFQTAPPANRKAWRQTVNQADELYALYVAMKEYAYRAFRQGKAGDLYNKS